jgi:hypothetical protein
MQASDLEDPTKRQLREALALDSDALASHSVEELGAALGKRAAALEAQLRAQRAATKELEARMKSSIRLDIPGRSTKSTRAPVRPRPKQFASAADAVDGLMRGTGELRVSSSQIGSTLSNVSSASGGVPRKQVITKANAAAMPAPVLGVGFAGDGPIHLAVQAPALMAPRPVVTAAFSDRSSSLLAKRPSSKVPTAPPLPPFRHTRPPPNDAATLAWKRHAAPQALGRAKVVAGSGVTFGRSVGGPAPPFLAAPPVVAAAMMAKAQGGLRG